MKIDANTIVLVLILLVLIFKKSTVVVHEQPIYEEITQIKSKKNEINNFKFGDSTYYTTRDSLRAIYNPE